MLVEARIESGSSYLKCGLPLASRKCSSHVRPTPTQAAHSPTSDYSGRVIDLKTEEA